jgi:hypothetical protein
VVVVADAQTQLEEVAAQVVAEVDQLMLAVLELLGKVIMVEMEQAIRQQDLVVAVVALEL